MKTLVARAALGLFAASSAFSQIDANSLREKYGAPLDRETFTVHPGIEMVVDYGPNKLAGQMWLSFPDGNGNIVMNPYQLSKPPIPPTDPAVFLSHGGSRSSKERIEEVVNELVPLSTRGAPGPHNDDSMTRAETVSWWDYEKLTIVEETRSGDVTTITIKLKDSSCSTKTGQ
jgi:hypothetical protein